VDYRLSASRGVRRQVSLRASRQRPFLDRTLGLLKASARPGLSLFLADVVRLVSEPQRKASVFAHEDSANAKTVSLFGRILWLPIGVSGPGIV
jgi:hypothetical protein